MLGIAVGWFTGDRFVAPEPIDPTQWHVVSPGLDETVVTPLLGRGSHVLGGALVIRQHAFYRADVLTLSDPRPVGRVDLLLAPDSGVLRAVMRASEGSPAAIWFTAEAYRVGPSHWTERMDPGQPWVLHLSEAGVRLEQPRGALTIGTGPATQLELTAESGEVRIAALRVEDTSGAVIFHEDFRRHRPGWGVLAAGALIGGLAGVAGASVLRRATGVIEGALGLGLCLGPPVLVALVPSGSWLWAVERLYLVRTAAWDLARLALALSLLPLTCSALLRSGALAVRHRRASLPSVPGFTWPLVLGVTTVLASRELEGAEWALAVPGAALLGVPWWLARRADQEPGEALLRDVPALLAVAALGWHFGLLLAMGWRLLVLGGSARSLLDRAPRPAADALWLTLLACLPAAELAVRGTYLVEGWDAARLSGELAPTVGWREATPFWKNACGRDGAASRLGVVWAGGSSMGGAYQFRGTPEAFFPAQVHARLCADLPEGTQLASGNFGDGSRDTFTISRTVDKMFAQVGDVALVVLYTGVNDVLTTNNAHTRKEREAKEAERSEALRGLSGVANRSRLFTGVGLAIRPLHESATRQVQDVPLPDAEENLRRIADAAAAVGVQVLLLTEYVAEEQQFLLEDYARMEARVADGYEHVHWIDVRAAMAGPSEAPLLVDRNHLSREGSARLADALAPRVRTLLGLADGSPP
ncbi:MAG: SGNH/GDSL hydrolase family protein [Deltaproteobacteria bacterium]|nr:SGNH/GDSL hydrolase family protein [Deltaproteobacteria bacterium]